MSPDENTIKHLEMIQSVIGRLGSNSFLVKGWSVATGAALYSIAIHNDEWKFAIIGASAVLIFWVLDAYYLHREKLFRRLFDLVRANDPRAADFCMNYTVADDRSQPGILGVMFTLTQALLHATVLVAGLLIAAIVFHKG